jgi:putative transposase
MEYNRTMRTFEYRLYPNRAQRQALMACLIESRGVYNAMLEASRARYKAEGRFLFRYDLCEQFKGRAPEHVPATVVQCLADRLDKALRRFLFAKEQGERCGFPRFKGGNRWHSIHLRQFTKGKDAWLDGRFLRVPSKIGKAIKIKMHRPLEGSPKTCHLVLRADGHWYALIVCETGPPPPCEPCGHPAVGIDVGLRAFLTDSDGRTVENPRFLLDSFTKMTRKQRVLSRRVKGSRRRRKAAKAVARLHLTIGRRRRDFHFKTAKPYAERFGTIAVEDLNVKGMVRNHHLARAFVDASWSAFVDILEAKAESAGHRVVRVPAHFTSQKCSRCGAMVPKSLSVRTHICTSCGYVADRDHNAARNILDRANGWGAAVGEPEGIAAGDEPRSRCL